VALLDREFLAHVPWGLPVVQVILLLLLLLHEGYLVAELVHRVPIHEAANIIRGLLW